MNCIEISNLHEPSTHSLHHLAASLETLTPVSLPLKKITRVKSIGAELEDTAKCAWWGGWPEGELLHQGDFLGVDELLKLLVEGRELWVLGNGVE